MSSCSKHHKKLTNGVGRCSVPMWSGGLPAGFCDEPAYSEKVKNSYAYKDVYAPYLACPAHGGLTKEEAEKGADK